jgi:hypothetical protein
VILFGNSQNQFSWNILLKDSPVQVNKNEITVGDKNTQVIIMHVGSCPRLTAKLQVCRVSGTELMECGFCYNFANYFEQ